MRHFDVQMIGGIVLHQGTIAEMRTGEGKTLVATLPAYLNALDRSRRARRDGQRLSRLARRRMDGPDSQFPRPRRSAASRTTWTTSSGRTPTPADITYGTNNEFGFDYLRDNMKFDCRIAASSAVIISRSSTKSIRS